MRHNVLLSIIGVGLLSGAFLYAQTNSGQSSNNNIITVEEAYLNSIEAVMINEMITAEGRDSKLVALQYIEEAVNNGRITDDIQKALGSLAMTGLSTVVREDGRALNNFPEIRRKACELLGKVKTEKSKETLVAVLYTDNESSVIGSAIQSLSDIGINNNDEVSDMINWIGKKFDTVNPTSSLALEILNAFEKMAPSINNKRNMFETILRISNNYAYIAPVRAKAKELMVKITNENKK